MAKKKSNNNNNEIIDSDEGEWEEVKSKEMRNKENNEKRDRKKQDLKKKRDQEIAQHNEKQKKIAELFENSSAAFDVKKRVTGYNPWDILDEDEDDFTYSDQHKSKKSNQQKSAENPNNGFHYPGSDKLSSSSDKLKKQQQQQLQKQKQQQQQQLEKSKQATFVNALSTFKFDSYYELLTNIESKYPKVIDVQIKSVAEFLENHFGFVNSDQLPFYQRIDYLSKFDDKFKNETVKFLSDKPVANISTIVTFLINKIISILRKDRDALGTSGVGLEILVQLIFRYFPDASLLKNVNYFKSINLPSLKTNVVNLHLWFMQQPIQGNQHSAAASIWLQVIFPILYKSKVSNFQNLELFEKFTVNLFELKRIQKNGIEIQDTVLANALDEFINASLLQTVQPIGMKYSNILFDTGKLFSNNQVPAAYFYVLLNYSTISDENQRNIFLNKIIECLNLDVNCFSYIKSRYVELIAQVNNLLLYILLKWKSLEKSNMINITKQNVYELAQYCKNENDNLITKYQTQKQLQKQQNIQQQGQKTGTLQINKLKNNKSNNSTPYDIEDVELCNVTCNSVIKTFKPSHFIRNFTLIVIVPALIVGCAYLSKLVVCQNDKDLHPFLKQHQENVDILQDYIC